MNIPVLENDPEFRKLAMKKSDLWGSADEGSGYFHKFQFLRMLWSQCNRWHGIGCQLCIAIPELSEKCFDNYLELRAAIDLLIGYNRVVSGFDGKTSAQYVSFNAEVEGKQVELENRLQ